MALEKNVLEELKNNLLSEKKKLEEDLLRFAKPKDAPGDFETKIENIGTDEDENATEVEEYTDNLALESSLEKQLKDVLGALDRMEKGNYGICDNCNTEIDIERLRAYPAAINCIKCK